MSRRAIVIGSGFGGLAAAIRTQAKGYDVSLVEARDKPGGRAYVYKDQGFTYDAGPTIVTVPFVLEELAEVAGRRIQDYVTLVPCDPYYRIYFNDGRVFDYRGEQDRLEAEIAHFNPDDVEGYRRFQDYSRRVYDRAFTDLAGHSFHSIAEMVKVAPDLIKLRSDRSVFSQVSRFIKDPALRMVFSFEPLLVGGNPLRVTSIYSMIHYLEKTWGVHFAMGGTGALVQGLVRLFEDIGGTLRLSTRVSEIVVENGATTGVRVQKADADVPSVLVEGPSEFLPADLVISNGDVANTYRRLIAPQHRRKWTDRRLERMNYAMSLFVIYFGTNRTYDHLPHHSIILGPRYHGLLKEIFDTKTLAEDFSLYLHAPTRTDPSLAPPGCECFYVLSPVPNLRGGQDWDNLKEDYADRILASMEQEHLVPDLRKHLVSKRIFTPKDFETQLDAFTGSAFQFAPTLTQSAWFRPHNKSEDVRGLYFVGAGTHPGAGMPGVISSAKVLDHFIPSLDAGRTPSASPEPVTA